MSSFVHLIDQRRLIGPGGSTVSGNIYFYYTGTSVLAPVYQDANMTIPSPNPISVGAGEIVPQLFLDNSIIYRRVIQYSDGTLDEQDPLGQLFSENEIGLPVGAIIDYSGPNSPEGFLFCFGQAISRTTYAELFEAIGTTYGSGNGTTTFNVPDYRGRVGAGKDNMGGVSAGRLTDSVLPSGNSLGAVGGEEAHLLTVNELPPHNHGGNTQDEGAHTHYVASGGTSSSPITGSNRLTANGNGLGDSDYALRGAAAVPDTGISGPSPLHHHAINSEGGGESHNNVQPTIITNKIIKVVPTSFLSLLGIAAGSSGKANALALGVDPTANDMGVFTGGLIPSNISAKEAIQALSNLFSNLLIGNLSFNLPDEADGDTIPPFGSGQMYLSGGVLKIA